MYEQEIKGKASTEAAMAEAVHARENGEKFSQVRNVLHFHCESLKNYKEATFYFYLFILGLLGEADASVSVHLLFLQEN